MPERNDVPCFVGTFCKVLFIKMTMSILLVVSMRLSKYGVHTSM
jgi:hypothetical protein